MAAPRPRRPLRARTSSPPSGCGGCHTLAAAGADGVVGPNLDELQPDAATVATVVSNGQGSMPAFDDLSDAELQAVADYVASSAGG